MRSPEKVQKANHCKKETIECGKYSVIEEGKGRVTIMTGRKIALEHDIRTVKSRLHGS